MDALVIVVIVVAVLMGLIGLGVVAGSGRTRRMDERRFHAEEVRREAEFTSRAERRRRRPRSAWSAAGASSAARRGRRFRPTRNRRTLPSICRGGATTPEPPG